MFKLRVVVWKSCRVAALAIASISLLAGPASAKPRGCFTKAEHTAEQNVRQGIFLREIAQRCEAPPHGMGTQSIWAQIEQQIGPQFKRDTDTRTRAFAREFGDRAQQTQTAWDGRLVMAHRHMFLTRQQCEDAKALLQEVQKRGFAAVRQQAQKSRNEVFRDYKSCG